jgi:hypothetical protein
MHIGFLYNHRLHQVFHTASIAFELASRDPGVAVTIIAANRENVSLLRQLASGYPEQRARLVLARVPAALRLLHRLLRGWFSVEKPAVKLFNRALFKEFDALVVPESTSLILKKMRGLSHLKLIRVPHGAGDREVAFDKRLSRFDLLLLPGRKTRDRLAQLGRLPQPGHYEIIGYPKFDLVGGRAPERLFANDLPVVLFNPHFSPGLSSWPRMGLKVLEFFLTSGKYNLIFAPHIMLFERFLKFRTRLPDRYCHCPHILVDTGSLRSSDMSYTLAADIYLGDVSSQVYEFLIRPRPCIFLNAHRSDWHADPFYKHWHLGQVLEQVSDLPRALEQAASMQKQFEQKQRQSFTDTFDLTDVPSSRRAADAILKFLQGAS